MIEDCTALILAGGDSRRMGSDKASLVLEGKTLLESVTATMQQVFPKVIVSVRELRAGVTVPQVRDEVLASGPLAGLVAGLAQVETPWMFAVACDMPFVTQALIERLALCRGSHLPLPPAFPLQGGGDDTAGGIYQAVVPMVGGFAQPLAAFYATSALGVMRATLEAGERSMRDVLKKLDVRYVSEAELRDADPQLRSFFDLDTPQDFEAAKK